MAYRIMSIQGLCFFFALFAALRETDLGSYKKIPDVTSLLLWR